MDQVEIQTGRQTAAPPVAPALNHDVRAYRWSECTKLTRLALSQLQSRNLDGVQQSLIAMLSLASQSSQADGASPAMSGRPAIAASSASLPLRNARQWHLQCTSPSLSERSLVIRALGDFEVTVNGIPIHGGRKAARKPLELLKALVARGDTSAGAAELADMLWPDAEGDAARDSLRVTLYRLRRLLTFPHAVTVENATLRLNAQVCWVDAWAFEKAAKDTTRACRDDDQLTQRLERALQIYRGHLFAHDGEQAWMLAPRERLRQHWLDVVYRAGTRYQTQGWWTQACRLYRHAAECDPAAEELYRRLMICQCNIGDFAEALHTYRRCRSQLTARFGIPPSAETERLYRSLSGAPWAGAALSQHRGDCVRNPRSGSIASS
jgi:DNA-binding SARP family transcriptional activator